MATKTHSVTLQPVKSYRTFQLGSYKPSIVGTFSSSATYGVIDVNSAKFSELSLPQERDMQMDLNEGMAEYHAALDKAEQEQPEEDDKDVVLPLWQKFLYWITKSGYDLSHEGIQVVCRRGILKGIGFTQTGRLKTPWSYRVCKYNGILYLYEPTVPGSESESQPVYLRKFQYWGRKFEKNVTRDPDPGVSASFVMARGKLGKFVCLLGCEVDCVRHKQQTPPKVEANQEEEKVGKGDDGNRTTQYIEIKTCHERKLQDKISFGWLQAFLAGNDVLVYGLRDGQGHVTKIVEEDVRTAPGRYANSWSGSSMMGLISSVLNKINEHVTEGREGVISYDGEGSCYIIRVNTKPGHFLPDWYCSWEQKGEKEKQKQNDGL